VIKSYNQLTHNDLWIIDLYKKKRDGYYVEAGALDGIGGSCTYTLEKFFGWTGLLVEPGTPFDALVKNRPGSICENVCITDNNGRVLFVDSNISGYSGIKEKLIHEDIKSRERWGKPRDQWESSGSKEKIIESITFYDLLKRHNAPIIIDYVAFDMEGSEYDALKNFPFEEYKIMAFSIEGDACNELLIAKGYKQIKNPFNTEAPWEYYFTHRDFAG
jgi:hypothetical protein